jgi:glycolate oxidase iron-sulfur subunit
MKLGQESGNEADACSLCGFCKYNCPVFRETKNEALSPRGRVILMKNGVLDKDVIFKCSICKACEKACPIKVDFRFEELRSRSIQQGKETEANKKMIENIRKYGNPFGKIQKGKIPDKLYCC